MHIAYSACMRDYWSVGFAPYINKHSLGKRSLPTSLFNTRETGSTNLHTYNEKER